VHAEWVADAILPTRHGKFAVHVFSSFEDSEVGRCEHDHVALVLGDVRDREDVLVRVHSECITSEVFGSLKCDCKDQLEASMAAIARAGQGAVLYLRQEGRSIGLANKIRAYALQDQGYDTVDANRILGLPDDGREYGVARDMLDYLQIRSVRLLTNNPAKVTALRGLGVKVLGQIPVVIAPNSYSASYLEAKRKRMAHDLPPLLLAVGGDAE
jgi:GTP cyclohydrolase II